MALSGFYARASSSFDRAPSSTLSGSTSHRGDSQMLDQIYQILKTQETNFNSFVVDFELWNFRPSHISCIRKYSSTSYIGMTRKKNGGQ